jgi:hypothetical protein
MFNGLGKRNKKKIIVYFVAMMTIMYTSWNLLNPKAAIIIYIAMIAFGVDRWIANLYRSKRRF